MKVMTIVGTRPEIIRLSRVIARLDATEGIEHVLVHTGQNYDRQLNEVFFEDLALREPDHYLGVDTSSLGAVLGGVLIETEKVLLAERPDAVLVLGDTNSCLACTLAGSCSQVRPCARCSRGSVPRSRPHRPWTP